MIASVDHTRTDLRWALRALTAIFAVLLAAASDAAPASEDREPELGYTLHVNGQPFRLLPNENRVIEGSFANPSIRLVPDRERHFTYGGVAFAYPSDFAFDADFGTLGLRQWSLDGNDFVIMVMRWERAKMGPNELAIQLRLTYGKAVTRKPISYRFNGRSYEGIRVTFKVAGITLFQDVPGLPSERGSRLLVLQGLVGHEKDKEATRVIKLLDETLEVGQ
jgi:hypothetical protein